MKILTTFITIAVLALQATAQAQDKGMRADIDKDIPLVDAVKRANEQFPDIQPLTEAEVIAAVQAIKLQHPDIKEPVYEIYQRVAKERILPKGMYFSHIPAWHTQYGHFQVDWKDLTLMPLPVGTKDEKIGYGFNYRIRARFISSRPLTESEANEMKDRAKMVEPGAPADGNQPLRSEANRTSGAAGPAAELSVSRMTTPQQFMEAFFGEKTTIFAEANARLEPVYAKYFGGSLSEHVDDFLLRDRQIVDEVKQIATSATVITRAHFRTADIRQRYHLSAVGENWRIIRIERVCFICGGTGRLGKKLCHECGGEGWYDNRKNNGLTSR